jgi:hypothetical protein
MGKVCTSCGVELESPNLPEGEDEMCENCRMDEDTDSNMGGDGMDESMDLDMGGEDSDM